MPPRPPFRASLAPQTEPPDAEAADAEAAQGSSKLVLRQLSWPTSPNPVAKGIPSSTPPRPPSSMVPPHSPSSLRRPRRRHLHLESAGPQLPGAAEEEAPGPHSGPRPSIRTCASGTLASVGHQIGALRSRRSRKCRTTTHRAAADGRRMGSNPSSSCLCLEGIRRPMKAADNTCPTTAPETCVLQSPAACGHPCRKRGTRTDS